MTFKYSTLATRYGIEKKIVLKSPFAVDKKNSHVDSLASDNPLLLEVNIDCVELHKTIISKDLFISDKYCR